ERIYASIPQITPCTTTSASSDILDKAASHLVSDAKPFECSACNKTFGRKSQLIEHSNVHNNEKTFKCSLYGPKFLKVDESEASFENLDNPQVNVDEDKCGGNQNLAGMYIPNQSTQTSGDHLTSGDNDLISRVCKPFKCSVCNKSFSLKTNLIRHLSIHNKEKPYKCSLCNESFTQKYYLSQHQYVHSDEKPFECSVCNKTFAQIL
ncbi:hypothetical protein L9F63_005244, partial [Diploptera punctata]